MGNLKLEAIKGLNSEKEILSSALPRMSHNNSIKVRSRLREIDEEIQKLIFDEEGEEEKDDEACDCFCHNEMWTKTSCTCKCKSSKNRIRGL